MNYEIILECIETNDCNKQFLNIGEAYFCKSTSDGVVVLMGEDCNYHLVELKYFKLVKFSSKVMNILKIVEHFQKQKKLGECMPDVGSV